MYRAVASSGILQLTVIQLENARHFEEPIDGPREVGADNRLRVFQRNFYLRLKSSRQHHIVRIKECEKPSMALLDCFIPSEPDTLGDDVSDLPYR